MSSTIQHRYNLRSTAKRALKQPVIVDEQPIIKISIFMYLLNMIAYFLETFSTPEVYKNMFKRQSEQDAINMQQEQEQEQDKEDEDEKDEDQEDEDEEDKNQEEDKEVVEEEEDQEHEDQERAVSYPAFV